MEKCVQIFEIIKRGKKRRIISYSNDKNGRQLRKKHEKIVKIFRKKASSKLSYAYKKGTSTKNAFEPHLSSKLFIKLDIKDFFCSISYDGFISKVLLDDELKDRVFDCFFENSLPIGFVSSPKLSDMYLYEFDVLIEKYLKSHNSLYYSRYCDDILISSKEDNFGSLHTFLSYIKIKLGEYGLTINQEKIREFDLNKDTSVQFLGLNLSYKDGKHRITISKAFILKTLDIISDAYNLKKNINENYLLLIKEDYWNRYFNNNEIIRDEFIRNLDLIHTKYNDQKKKLPYVKNIVKSRVAYIKYNSEVSYKRFLKKHENKFNVRWGEIWL